MFHFSQYPSFESKKTIKIESLSEQTNSLDRIKLIAYIRALQDIRSLLKNCEVASVKIVVIMDSIYVKELIKNWLSLWKGDNYYIDKSKPRPNRDLLLQLEELSDIQIIVEYQQTTRHPLLKELNTQHLASTCSESQAISPSNSLPSSPSNSSSEPLSKTQEDDLKVTDIQIISTCHEEEEEKKENKETSHIQKK